MFVKKYFYLFFIIGLFFIQLSNSQLVPNQPCFIFNHSAQNVVSQFQNLSNWSNWLPSDISMKVLQGSSLLQSPQQNNKTKIKLCMKQTFKMFSFCQNFEIQQTLFNQSYMPMISLWQATDSQIIKASLNVTITNIDSIQNMLCFHVVNQTNSTGLSQQLDKIQNGIFQSISNKYLVNFFWSLDKYLNDLEYKPFTDTQEISEMGFDLSHHNGIVNWTKISEQNLSFVFIKSTDGNNFIDPMYQYNWNQSQIFKLKRGAYHYFHPCLDPISQAEFFVNNTQKGELPPVLDMEDADCGEFTDINGASGQYVVAQNALMWLQYVEQKFNQTPIVYTYDYFADQFLSDDFSKYGLWLAQWMPTPYPLPKIWNDNGWQFWQYSNNGTVQGVSGPCNVDISKFKL